MTDSNEILATPEEIKKALANDDTIILDVRGPEEILETGYLKTKRGRSYHQWIPLACTRTEAPLLEMTMNSLFRSDKKDTPILVHCKSGKRAELAKSVLEKAGYTNVINAGGWTDVEPFVVKE